MPDTDFSPGLDAAAAFRRREADKDKRVAELEAAAEKILKACNEARAKREALMPDEKTALQLFFDAWLRLKDFGWSEAVYCPKDGSHFQVIEAGSTGIHDCSYSGEWPKGSWWVYDGDVWPSRPVLYRLYPEDEAKRKAKMQEAARRFAKIDQTNR